MDQTTQTHDGDQPDPNPCFCLTDVGRQRDHNEDNVLCKPQYGLWLVADGMGGHEHGELAAKLAVEVISERVGADVPLPEAIQQAHEAIRQAGEADNVGHGMGTTVVALQLHDHHYEIAWVGDSRAYLSDGVNFQQLTCDHSYVQALFDLGKITEEEALHHPDRNVIIQSLGSRDIEHLKVGTVHGVLHRGERILLCSDGLTTEVDDAAIKALCQAESDLPQLVSRLVEQANTNGGSDNISVIVVNAAEGAPEPDRRRTRPIRALLSTQTGARKHLGVWIYLFIGAAVAALLAVTLFWWQARGRGPEQQSKHSPSTASRRVLLPQGTLSGLTNKHSTVAFADRKVASVDVGDRFVVTPAGNRSNRSSARYDLEG